MKTLAIETSCDDTSLAIVDYKNWYFDVKDMLLYSQIKEHTKFGWVVPELASRLHEQKIIKLIDNLWLDQIKKVDFISYTCCPWLPWSLLVWRTLANTLSIFLEKKLVPVHHITGHIMSILCNENINNIQFPIVVLTVSGGHNNLYIVENIKEENNINELDSYSEQLQNNYSLDQDDLIIKIWKFKITKIWFTLDDAAGEVFDKVSRMLDWPYPGGEWIWNKAKLWKKMDFDFPRIWLKKAEFNFSFSGLKASVNYKIQELKKEFWEDLSEDIIRDIAFEFEQAVIETLWKKLLKAAKFFNINNIALVGGVSANQELKTFITNHKEKFWIKNFYTPKKNLYSTDNAAMIWVAWIINEL